MVLRAPPPRSATATVKVSVGVHQELLAVHVQTVYVVPGVAHVALDPLHRVLLGQPAPRGGARLHRPGRGLFLVVLLLLVGRGGGGGAGGGGGRGGGGGGRGGRRGQGGPGRERVLSGAAPSLAARREETKKSEGKKDDVRAMEGQRQRAEQERRDMMSMRLQT